MILNNDSHTNRAEFLFQDIPAVGVGGYEQATAGLGVAEPEFHRIGQGAAFKGVAFRDARSRILLGSMRQCGIFRGAAFRNAHDHGVICS